MKILEIPIDDLIFAEYNPRQLSKEQHQHLTDSLKRFGFVDPVIVNKHKSRENIIIGGHMRIRIAKELDYKTVPCVYVNLDADKERELNIRLNQNTGSFDFDLLANNFDTEDLLDWGFSEVELNYSKEPNEKEYDENLETENECPKCGYEW